MCANVTRGLAEAGDRVPAETRSTIRPLRSVPEQSADEADQAANAVSGRAGCSAWSGYFLAFLACRFSFSVF